MSSERVVVSMSHYLLEAGGIVVCYWVNLDVREEVNL